MKLNFTTEQYNLLAPYRSYFQTAVHERWSRNPGRTPLTIMADVWREVAHLPGFRMDYNCGTCIVNLLTDLGTLFFQDEKAKASKAWQEVVKAEEALDQTGKALDKAADAMKKTEEAVKKVVATTDAPAETVKAKSVKTAAKKKTTGTKK